LKEEEASSQLHLEKLKRKVELETKVKLGWMVLLAGQCVVTTGNDLTFFFFKIFPIFFFWRNSLESRHHVGSKPQGLGVFGVIGGFKYAPGDREEPGQQVQQ
jgi:hypothetical protein